MHTITFLRAAFSIDSCSQQYLYKNYNLRDDKASGIKSIR
jgi:hypothetical protein